VAATLVVISLGPLAAPAAACSCAEESVAEAVARAGAIVEGRVVTITDAGDDLEVTLAVTQGWRGLAHETIAVRTEARESACGFPFELGESYLVYTEPGDGLRVSRCSRTRPAADADADRRGLGSGTIPVDIEDEAIPPVRPARTVAPRRAGCAGCAAAGQTGPPAVALAVVLALLGRRIRA
jgi:uncharacterized protein (TIGR03382 family)